MVMITTLKKVSIASVCEVEKRDSHGKNSPLIEFAPTKFAIFFRKEVNYFCLQKTFTNNGIALLLFCKKEKMHSAAEIRKTTVFLQATFIEKCHFFDGNFV